MFTAADKGPDKPLPGCQTPHPSQGSVQPRLKISLRKARKSQVSAPEKAQARSGKGSRSRWVLNGATASMLRRHSAAQPRGQRSPPLSNQMQRVCTQQDWSGKTEAEAPILWPPDAKSRLIRKDPDAGKDGREEEEGTTEDEMVEWHHWLNGYEFEAMQGDSVGQRSLVSCSSCGHKVLYTLRDWTITTRV